MVTEKEMYLFDLNGFLVIKGALDPKNLAEINQVIDEEQARIREKASHIGTVLETVAPHFGVPFVEHEVFRRLIDSDKIVPYLRAFKGTGVEEHGRIGENIDRKGSGVRLDQAYFTFTEKSEKGVGLHLGGTPFYPCYSYRAENGRIYSTMTVVGYCLNDIPATGGGFACIPGSHKSKFPCPADFSSHADRSASYGPKLEPGDAVIFTEALTHGAFPWTGDYPRRALFYKYTAAHISNNRPHWSDDLIAKCTPDQKNMLQPAFLYDGLGIANA